MSQSLLYITFKDTCSEKNLEGQKIALNNVIAQLYAAVDRIKADPTSVYDYVRIDSPYSHKLVEPKLTTPAKLIDETTANEEMLESVFVNLKRTHKSDKIIKYFIQNSGNEVDVDEIAAGASLSKADVNSWLGQTGKKVAAITNPARGVYKFNPDKLTN